MTGGSAKAATGPAGRPGRRERQKALRERRILRAAAELFGRRGYARTTMEDVARRAKLAVGTLYNYFPSKAEIVLALLRRDTGEALAAADAVLDAPSDDPAEAIAALFDVYVDLLAGHDRHQLRELVAASIIQPDPIGRAAFEIDLRLVSQLAGLLVRLRDGGSLAADLDAPRAATTLYAVYATWFVLYATLDEVTVERVRQEVRVGVELVVRGLLPRPTAPPSRFASESSRTHS